MEVLREINLLEPGIYFDYPANEYHRLPYVSNSYLGMLKDCPAAARESQKETEPMVFGRQFHTIILEPHLFDREYYSPSDIAQGNSSLAKKMRAKEVLDNLDKAQILPEKMAQLQAMKARVFEHPFARDLLRNKWVEVTLIWDHVTRSGLKIRMKCRIDCIPKVRRGEPGFLVDLKSAKDSSPKGFRYQILDKGYYRQAAVYLDGINTVAELYRQEGRRWPLPEWFEDFIFIACGKAPPYRVECYNLSPASYEEGRIEYLQLIEIERACRQAKGGPFYPAYQFAGMNTIDVADTVQYQRKMLEI